MTKRMEWQGRQLNTNDKGICSRTSQKHRRGESCCKEQVLREIRVIITIVRDALGNQDTWRHSVILILSPSFYSSRKTKSSLTAFFPNIIALCFWDP